MTKNLWGVYAKVVTHRVILIAVGLCIIGFVLITMGMKKPSGSMMQTRMDVILVSVGATLLSAGMLSSLWELFAKRAYTEETLRRVGLKNDVVKAGIVQFVDNFRSAEIDWEDILVNARELDLFVCWAYTWRNMYQEKLKGIINRKAGKIRLILPDLEDDLIVKRLSHDFKDYDDEKVKQRISEAIDFFKELDSNEESGHVEIWCISCSPQFSWYRIDNKVVFAFSAHRGKDAVPVIIGQEGGFLYDFATKEFEFLFEPTRSRSRRVYPI